MKKRTLSWLIAIGVLAIPLLLFSFSISKISPDNEHKTSTLVSNFSYQQEEEQIGFAHITFHQNNVYNPHTNKYEYFLNQAGKKYLIDRFMETSVIGPEISSIRNIIIYHADERIIGKYDTLTKTIYINPFPFLIDQKYQLWRDQGQILVQKKRVEVIMHILVHEYGHHFFNVYASSPIGYSQHSPLSRSNVQMVYSKGKRLGCETKDFITSSSSCSLVTGLCPGTSTLSTALLIRSSRIMKNSCMGQVPA